MIYNNIKGFLKKRTIELIGLTLISAALLLAISFFSYSPSDPTFIYGDENVNIHNLLGIYGVLIADFLLQSFGLSAFLFLITITSWGISLIIKKELKKIQYKIFFLILYLIFICIFINITFNSSFWLIDNGNSGLLGQVLYNWISNTSLNVNNEYTIFIFIVLGLIFFFLASNINVSLFWSAIKKASFIFKKKK